MLSIVRSSIEAEKASYRRGIGRSGGQDLAPLSWRGRHLLLRIGASTLIIHRRKT